MKELRIFLAYLLAANPAYALVTENSRWEVRTTATAGNLNGCAYDPFYGETDGTQQNEHAYHATDLRIGSATTQVGSLTVPFLSSHTGNALHVTAGTGFTQGWHTIKYVNVEGTATLNSPAGSLGSTGGTGRVGGACSLASTLDDDMFEAVNSSNVVWINSGTYTLGEAVAIATDATNLLPVDIIGYGKVRGDKPRGGDLPVLATGANGLDSQGAGFRWRNMSFTGTASAVATMGTISKHENLKSVNTSGTAGRTAITLSAASILVGSELVSTNGIGINFNSNFIKVYGNYIHHSTNCMQMGNLSNINISYNLFETCYSTAILCGATFSNPQSIISYNTIFGSSAYAHGTGITQGAGTPGNGDNMIFGNILYGLKVGISIRNKTNNYYDYNNFFNNEVNITTAAENGPNDTFVDPQFTDWVNSDFRIGSNLKGLGFPGAFGSSRSTGSLDIGAVHRAEPAASGGTRGFLHGQ